jgi:hypothetical protein
MLASAHAAMMCAAGRRIGAGDPKYASHRANSTAPNNM